MALAPSVLRVVAAGVLLLGTGACDAQGTDWEAVHRDVVPASRAAWEEVPWRLDLLAAREESRASGRPLFFWAMNGHPCGCT
jgi:hypothetical protein